ncbi:MAG: glycosyltransferase [Bacteroidetes bacterium]|nr:glycosyltransferase [Bacteroidota bacterium]MCW5896251.1 glycosyltransferase [Bacteroidota bacterium]
MRIAIVGTRGYPYVYSGYETFVAELAPRLVQNGHCVTVYCHRGLFRERPPAVNGVNLCYIPAIEHKVLSQFTHSLLSTLHVVFHRFDAILYVNSANGPFGLLTKLVRKKTAINVDGLEWLRPKWKGLGAKYFRIASYLATKWFDVIISDSDEMAEIYRKEFAAPSVTIAYGANIAHSSHFELIQQFGLTKQEYYLIVGRLIPDNNADLVVRAFEKSATKKSLVILGDVPYKDSYAESIRKTKDTRVVFPGYIKDGNVLRELYCNSFVYIHGHEFGGTNPALLKALAYGCCVLALDTPFNREVLANEKHGIFFAKNEQSLRDGLSLVESNVSLVEKKRLHARERILEKYTWELITSQYENLFERMVQRE